MKIVCESCGAKYSIADEKVAGKVFKIRCKKCSAVIVVRGDEIPTSEADAEEPQVGAEDPNAIWYVVIDGEQQGPYTPAQVGELISAGTVDWESYVWRDGFEGWLAAREAQELADAIQQGAPTAATSTGVGMTAAGAAESAVASASAASASAAGGGAAAASSGSFGTDPFATAQPAQAQSPLAGADLFAQSGNEPSPFDGGSGDSPASPAASAGLGGGGLAGAVASAPASTPQPTAGASAAGDEMTGRRSENSVLFSLSNLQALATGGSNGAGPSPAPSASTPQPSSSASSTTEGSGLIDIRALASTNGSVGAAPAADSGGSIDDLLSIGTGTPLASSLTAPVLAPAEEEKKGSKGMMMLVLLFGFVAVLAVAAVALVYILRTPTGPALVQSPQAITPGTDGTDVAGDAPDPAEATDTPNMAEDVPSMVEAADPRPDERRTPRDRDPRRDRPNDRTTTMRDTPTMVATMDAPTMTAPTMTTPSMTSMGSLDIDDLLRGATMTPAAAMMAAAPDANLPEAPSRSQVASSLRAVSGQVRACGNGQHGTAMTSVVVAGATGRVQSARVQGGPFAGTPAAACIANAVRGARFPRFQRSTFTVTFPYTL